MAARYRVTVPPTWHLGSYAYVVGGGYLQTYKAEALQEYNRARAHEGAAPLSRMPKGTTYTRVDHARQ